MSKFYAHKKFVGEVKVAEEDGILLTQVGEFPYEKGTSLLFPISGDPEIIPENKLEKLYVPVEPVKKKHKKEMSPFEEQYIKQLMEFGSLESTEEDEQYIVGTKRIVKERHNKNN